MLFDAREFEHYFSSTLLLKGLRLFEKGQLEPEGRAGAGEFKFLAENRYDLVLKKRGDKILSYYCSCNKTIFCEHLCAALFYFQKDALGVSVKDERKVSGKSKAITATKDLVHVLKEVDQASLIKFIEEYADGNPLFKETVLAHFSSGSEENALNFHRITVKNLLASVISTDNLQQKQLDDVYARLENLISKQQRVNKLYSPLFYLRLAINEELPVIFNSRITGDETNLLKFMEHNCSELDHYFFKGLTTSEKRAWLDATLVFLKSNSQLYAPVFSFMITKAVSLIKNKEEANDLKKLLERKNLKLVRSAGGLNILEIVKLELAVKEAELFKTPFPFKKYNRDPELIVARAELYFCSRKADKAFAYLEENYAGVKEDSPKSAKAYADYIISKAKEKEKFEIEIKYLEENLIYGPHISPKDLDRFLELIPVKKKAAHLNNLAEKIRVHEKNDIDKISMIFLKAGRLNDLIKELKKHNNRFNLVHKIATQTLPDHTPELLDLYLQQLTSALFEAKYTNYQQPLFLLAKKYLDKLPPKIANDFVGQLLKQIEFVKPLYSFIHGYYPHALGIKIKNK